MYMSLEIEHNFYDFDIEYVKNMLTKLGAKRKISLFKVYRSIDKEKGLRIRLRDEDHRKTFTIKNV